MLLFPNYTIVLSKILVLSTSTCYFCPCSLTFIICVPFFPCPLGCTLFLCSYISSVTSLSFPPSVFSPCHMNFPHPCLLFWFHLAICHFFVALLNLVCVLHHWLLWLCSSASLPPPSFDSIYFAVSPEFSTPWASVSSKASEPPARYWSVS